MDTKAPRLTPEKPESLEEARNLGVHVLRFTMNHLKPDSYARIIADPLGDHVFQHLGSKIGESLHLSGEEWTYETFRAHLKAVWGHLQAA